jgi:predicted secreted Zn-dependent protease
MKIQKFTPDYILSIIPDQYNASIDGNDLVISTEYNYLSINSKLITDIETEHVTTVITIRKGKIYNIITLWKYCTHLHNITFKV